MWVFGNSRGVRQRFAGLVSYEVSLLDLSGLRPNWHRSVGGVEVGSTLPSYGYDGRTAVVRLRCQRVVFYVSAAGDPAHGVVEGQAEDLDEEVDGVVGEVAPHARRWLI